ncbi:MAG TPA: hypothetical protein PKU69_05350, partial [Bacillota bacterium]|nr:hypothetical protein [Bacillota bacterium]
MICNLHQRFRKQDLQKTPNQPPTYGHLPVVALHDLFITKRLLCYTDYQFKILIAIDKRIIMLYLNHEH